MSLPLRIELWNGQHIDLSNDPPRVTIRLPRASAARYLLTPSLSNLGSAYVEGAIDVRGAATDMISIVNALARTSLKAEGKFSRIVRSIGHDKKKDAEAIRYHYDVSNDLRPVPRPEHGLFLRLFRERRRGPGDGAGQEDRPHPAQDRAARRPDAARHRLRLGRAGD